MKTIETSIELSFIVATTGSTALNYLAKTLQQ